jgi:hypothetical protein
LKKIIVIVLSLIMLMGCNQNRVHHNKELEESFHSVMQKENIDQLKLNTLTDFTWDKAFIFTPYTPQENITKQLGAEFKEPSKISSRDDINLVVFMNNEKVIQYVEVDRKYGDLIADDRNALTPMDNIIEIKKH